MSQFIGTGADEFITTTNVSPTVSVSGTPPFPSYTDDLIQAGAGNDVVSGGGGADIVDLGSGNDRFIWNPGDGSDVVHGRGGIDVLEFNASAAGEILEVSTAEGRTRVTRNIGSSLTDLGGMEILEFSLRAGTDQLVVHELTGSGVTEVRVDLAALPGTGAGDAAVDVVTLEGRAGADTVVLGRPAGGAPGSVLVTGLPAKASIVGGEAQDILIVNTMAGDDTIDASAYSGMALRVDGGAGLDRLRFDGTAAADRLAIGASGSSVYFARDGQVVGEAIAVERADISAGGGADQIAIGTLDGTELREVRVDLGRDTAIDVLDVAGSQTGDRIIVSTVGTETVVSGLWAGVRVTGGTKQDRLVLSALGGDDIIDASTLAPGIGLVVNGGLGRDLFVGGAGNDHFIGGDGDDIARLGAGDDTFTWNPGDDNDTVDGQEGIDTVLFNGANIGEKLDVSAIATAGGGLQVRLTRDVASVTTLLDSIERIVLNTLGGTDTINVALPAGTAPQQVLVDLAASGGTNADGLADLVIAQGGAGTDSVRVESAGSTVTVNGLPAKVIVDHADAALDRLVVMGNGGSDTLDATRMTQPLLQLTLDGGEGADTLIGGVGDDHLLGGDGDDRFITRPGSGNDRVDGGQGRDTLQVDGDASAESYTVTANGDRVRVDRLSPAPFVVDAGTVEDMVFNLGGGNDTFAATGNLAALVRLSVDGGAGDDTIRGGNGDDLLQGGAGNDLLDGNQGNDTILMGAGDDLFQWDPGDGSDTVDGGSGLDTVRFSGAAIAEAFRIQALGDHVLLQRNIASIVTDIVGVEVIDLKTLGGADTVAIENLSGTAVRDVKVDLGGIIGGSTGDGAADTVSANGRESGDSLTVAGSAGAYSVQGLPARLAVTNSEAIDTLALSTLGGNDKVDARGLQAGVTRLLVATGAGNDSVFGSRGDDVVLLGTGDDTMTVQAGDGMDVVEGEEGNDTLVYAGNDAAEMITVAANNGRVLLVQGSVGGHVVDAAGIETLRIAVAGGADQVAVGDVAGTGVALVSVDLAGAGGVADGQLDSVSVAGSATADVIKIQTSGSVTKVTGLAARVDIKSADLTDQVTINAMGGDDVIDASSFNGGALTILGGLGVDRITGSARGDVIAGGDGNDIVAMGAGDDRFVWSAGDDNDTVDGGSGDDLLQVNGTAVSEEVTIAATAGGAAQFLRNVASVTINFDGIEDMLFNAGAGNDVIVVGDLSGTDVRRVTLDMAGFTAGVGDGVADTVVVHGTHGPDNIRIVQVNGALVVKGLAAEIVIQHFDPMLDTLVIFGLDGNDRIDASALGAGSGRFQFDGGDGNDTLLAGAGGMTLLGGQGDDVLMGGIGDDLLVGGAGLNTITGGGGFDLIF